MSGDHLRWTRVIALAAVLLIHVAFLAVLLEVPPGWRRPDAETPTASPDALEVRLLPPTRQPDRPPRAAMPAPQPAHASRPSRLPAPVARATHATTQPAPPTPPAVPHAIDSLIVTAPPSYIAGGGRFARPEYGQQGVRVPGSGEPVHGMPVFRMADPRMQGVAGLVRMVGSQFGAIDPHCLKLDIESNMTARERIANHVDAADSAQDEAIAERYGCPDPLKPGAPMYYAHH
ncbi:hypothetical protein [Rhodanobacter sp. DHB23]|uniref:hypothetical protein n=1 Tax=Rhodanobacter sp. DHB23 TaxID=2775923 RepID=UPI001780D2BC|nr:hypothetical protein [Rhodanobacter sp. DHB23]MBD8874488.1 hypothetical protein [Rhodanobacter sp. DHB23]